MRELIPKVCAFVGAAAMYLLFRFADAGAQAQGAASALVGAKAAFQAVSSVLPSALESAAFYSSHASEVRD